MIHQVQMSTHVEGNNNSWCFEYHKCREMTKKGDKSIAYVVETFEGHSFNSDLFKCYIARLNSRQGQQN